MEHAFLGWTRDVNMTEVEWRQQIEPRRKVDGHEMFRPAPGGRPSSSWFTLRICYVLVFAIKFGCELGQPAPPNLGTTSNWSMAAANSLIKKQNYRRVPR